MPLFYQHINEFAKIAIWQIAEEKKFFLEKVPLQREITHPHKQLQHLAGMYLLQYLYPDFPYHLIEIADTRKPFLQNEEYHFSISHSGDYAAVIISKYNRVGIDIELISAKAERIKNKFLNVEELEMVSSEWPLVTQRSLLTLLWSCKEAIFKWAGSNDVDFRKDIRLKRSDINDSEGTICCDFLKDNISLVLQYKFFENVCLAWVTN